MTTLPKTHTRYAIIEVKVAEDWLTDDGEYTIQSGWETLEERLRIMMPRCMNLRGERNPDVKVSFDEWQEDTDAPR